MCKFVNMHAIMFVTICMHMNKILTGVAHNQNDIKIPIWTKSKRGQVQTPKYTLTIFV